MTIPEKTERQDALIIFLKQHEGYITQDIILYSMADYYGLPPHDKNYHDTAQRSMLTKDLEQIRLRGDATIISSTKGIKLCSMEQARKWHERRLNSIKRAFAKERQAIKALGLDQQIDVDGEIVDIIKEESNG